MAITREVKSGDSLRNVKLITIYLLEGHNNKYFHMIYFMFSNTYANKGDRSKIFDYLESKSLQAEEECDNFSANLYRKLSNLTMKILINEPCDKLNLGFPKINHSQREFILDLLYYLRSRYFLLPSFFDLNAYKFNTAVTVINELFKPSPNYAVIESILKTYKDHIDKDSFLRKMKWRSRDGAPGDLRYILANILKSKNGIEQNLEEKQEIIPVKVCNK